MFSLVTLLEMRLLIKASKGCTEPCLSHSLIPILILTVQDSTTTTLMLKRVHTVTSRYVSHPFLQLLHEADGIGERFPLVTSQRLQVQDGLCALGLKDSDGLQQPLITDTERSKVRQQ